MPQVVPKNISIAIHTPKDSTLGVDALEEFEIAANTLVMLMLHMDAPHVSMVIMEVVNEM